MKKFIVLLMLLCVASVSYAAGGKVRGAKGQGTTATGSTAQGSATQIRAGR